MTMNIGDIGREWMFAVNHCGIILICKKFENEQFDAQSLSAIIIVLVFFLDVSNFSVSFED